MVEFFDGGFSRSGRSEWVEMWEGEVGEICIIKECRVSSFRGGSSLIREFLALRIASRVGCGILMGSSWVDRPRPNKKKAGGGCFLHN